MSRASLHQVVDLTVADQLGAWGLSAADIVDDDMDRCREVAAVAVRLGAEGIRWASATGTGQSVALFIDRLLPGSRAEVTQAYDLTREMLAAIEGGANVRVLVPELAAIQIFS